MNKLYRPRQKVSELWLEFVTEGVCGLCGNSGIAAVTARTPRGKMTALARPCICPNGRALKKQRDRAVKGKQP